MSGSPLEAALLMQIQAAGLPAPVREFAFAKEATGRLWRLDLCWPDRMFGVEVQGGSFVSGRHQGGQGSEQDDVKAVVALFLGWRVVRVNTHMCDDGRALLLVEAGLGFCNLSEAALKVARWTCQRCDIAKTSRRRRQRAKLRQEEDQ